MIWHHAPPFPQLVWVHTCMLDGPLALPATADYMETGDGYIDDPHAWDAKLCSKAKQAHASIVGHVRCILRGAGDRIYGAGHARLYNGDDQRDSSSSSRSNDCRIQCSSSIERESSMHACVVGSTFGEVGLMERAFPWGVVASRFNRRCAC